MIKFFYNLIGWFNKRDNRISKDQECMFRPKPLKTEVLCQFLSLNLVFWSANNAFHPIEVSTWQRHHIVKKAEAEKDPGVVIVPDDDDDNWPDTGPQNIKEAKAYTDKIVNAFDTFGDLIHQDNKDALPKMIRNLKKIMEKHWVSMEPVDLEVVIRSISNPGCLHLWQHLTRQGPEAVDPVQDFPEPWTFIHKLLEKQHRREETEMIVSIFDHMSEALAHLSTAAVH